MGSFPTLVRVFLCPCVGPVPSVGLTLTWFIWDRNLALHVTLHSRQLILSLCQIGINSVTSLTSCILVRQAKSNCKARNGHIIDYKKKRSFLKRMSPITCGSVVKQVFSKHLRRGVHRPHPLGGSEGGSVAILPQKNLSWVCFLCFSS